MVTSSPATLVVRDATLRDAYTVTQTLSAAFSGSALGRWLDPDERGRPGNIWRGAAAVVTQVVETGIVRVVEDAGQVVAAAVWSMDGRWPLPAADRVDGQCEADVEVRGRWKLLGEAACTRRPLHLRHQQLVLLGVRPARRGQGLSSYLLLGRHALLHVTGVAAYALADESNRTLLLRHGYTAIGPPQLLPGRVPIWAMWRTPSPADLQ